MTTANNPDLGANDTPNIDLDPAPLYYIEHTAYSEAVKDQTELE